jgi:D-3-phosphoglycerate dehydrogenase
MKKSAIVVNTARGGLVDEEALAEALAEGRIAGAGLDLFVSEPPAQDHPLFGSDRLVLSPHSAGLTQECAARISISAVQNFLDFFDGRLDPALVVNARNLSDTAARQLLRQ